MPLGMITRETDGAATTLPKKTAPIQPPPLATQPMPPPSPTGVPLQPAPSPVKQAPPLVAPAAPNADRFQSVTKEPTTAQLGSFGQGTAMPGPERMTDTGTGVAPWLPDSRFTVVGGPEPEPNVTDGPNNGDPVPTGGYGPKGDEGTPGGGITGGGATTGGTTVTGKPQSARDIFNQLLGASFSYDPFSDPEYKNAAAQLENQIIQTMVGRGGLYSSIARDRVQQGLTQLQDQFRQRAYERWTSERNFTLDLAGFAMRLEERDYDRWMDGQRMAVDRQNSDALSAFANAQMEQANFDKMLARWNEAGVADNTVASFFGVRPGTMANNPYALQQIESKRTKIDSQITSAEKLVMNSTNSSLKMDLIEAARKEAAGTAPQEEVPITSEDISGAALTDVFAMAPDPQQATAMYWRFINNIKFAKTPDELGLALTQAMANRDMLVQLMGPYAYFRLSEDAMVAAGKRGDELAKLQDKE